ncbi:ras-related protein Rab-33B [Brachyhypopomus gauderio]|uniref:ras-related protein Rab-33B n=1 Tax=Brachyhypopomus gauderio TaxID=698409 RepID=UPI0040432224
MESSLQRGERRQPLAYSRTFKIIVIGDSGVGKTCLAYRFCKGQFPSKTESTIGVDFRERILDIEGEKIKVQLWDTAGQERFRKSMVQHYYRDAHAAVFVYDVSDVSSFRSLPLWLEECRQHSLSPDVPRVLVGNKADLVPSVTTAAVVEQARHLAEVHAMPFHLCSARGGAGEQVDAVFTALAHRLKRQGGGRWRGGRAVVVESFKLPAKAEGNCKELWACSC